MSDKMIKAAHLPKVAAAAVSRMILLATKVLKYQKSKIKNILTKLPSMKIVMKMKKVKPIPQKIINHLQKKVLETNHNKRNLFGKILTNNIY